MSIKIAITYEKGGVGKTTTAVNVSSILAEQGNKVLLLDLDFQAYASTYFSVKNDISIYNLLVADTNICVTDVIVNTGFDNLYLLPANRQLEQIEEYLIVQKQSNAEYNKVLKNALVSIENEYDYIIIDCPPNGGYIKENALVYADYLILPTIPDDNALSGLQVLVKKIIDVKQFTNPALEILGLLITIDEQTNLKKAYKNALQQQKLIPSFETTIRKNTTLCEARNARTPINYYNYRCTGYQDYLAFVSELKNRINKSRGDDIND